MAAESSNTGFHRHAMTFQSDVLNISSTSTTTTSEAAAIAAMSNFYGSSSAAANPSSSIILPAGNSTMNSPATLLRAPSTSSACLLLDSIPGLKHDAGLAVEWSVDEQYKLEEGLVKSVRLTCCSSNFFCIAEG